MGKKNLTSTQLRLLSPENFRRLLESKLFTSACRGHLGQFIRQWGWGTRCQLGEVRKVTLARVLCDNTDDTSSMQRHVFELPGPGNRRVSCASISQMDLSAWRESATVVGQVRDFFTDYFGGLRG
uniref:Uncharacterized protein n=1 Tax=Branchiostoma floridae TaxID=7739 RepID=C3ZKX8_BRAFL|eukprot:XP_002590649.1 hypothetical protein BRAFLDRAFT_89449 [Branchiostoma floridae]